MWQCISLLGQAASRWLWSLQCCRASSSDQQAASVSNNVLQCCRPTQLQCCQQQVAMVMHFYAALLHNWSFSFFYLHQKTVWKILNKFSSSCSPVLWNNWRRLGSIAPISTALPITTWVVSTTFSTCRSQITFLCHTTFRVCISSSEILSILIIELTSVPWCTCSSKWWSRSLLLLVEWYRLTSHYWCPDSFPYFLAFLFLISSLSLNLSSSTFWIINLAMPISPIR